MDRVMYPTSKIKTQIAVSQPKGLSKSNIKVTLRGAYPYNFG